MKKNSFDSEKHFSYVKMREKEKNDRYIKELKNQPLVGLMEWVDMMCENSSK